MNYYLLTTKKYINEKQEKTYNAICKLYIFISFLLFAFMNTQDATSFGEILVPHISKLVIYYHVFLTVIIIFWIVMHSLIYDRILRIDGVLIILGIRCILDLFSHILNIEMATGSFWGFYANTVISFACYFIGLQIEDCQNQIKYLYALFILIIIIQTFWTAILIPVDYFDLTYKSYMNIPYGGSNIIASLLVPGFFLTFSLKTKWKYIFCFLLICAVIATKSRGGVLLLILTSSVYFICIKKYNRNAIIKRILFILLIIIILLMLFFTEVGEKFLAGYAGTQNINDLTSGRIKIFFNDFKEALQRPLFGHGLGIGYTNQVGSHNLFIDLLYKCGVIGFSIYIIALILLTKNRTKNRIQSFYSLFLIVMLINSMFEVCYFSYKCDAIFWLTAGIFSSFRYRKDVQSKNE